LALPPSAKYLFLQVVLASLLLGAFQLGIPLFIEHVVDQVRTSSDVHPLNLLLGGMLVVVAGLRGDACGFGNIGGLHIAQALSLQMTPGLFRHLLQLPLRYLHSRRSAISYPLRCNHRLLNLVGGKALMLGWMP